MLEGMEEEERGLFVARLGAWGSGPFALNLWARSRGSRLSHSAGGCGGGTAWKV